MSNHFRFVVSLSVLPLEVFAMQSSPLVRIANNEFRATARMLYEREASIGAEGLGDKALTGKNTIDLTPEKILELETLGKFQDLERSKHINSELLEESNVILSNVNPLAQNPADNVTVEPKPTEESKSVNWIESGAVREVSNATPENRESETVDSIKNEEPAINLETVTIKETSIEGSSVNVVENVKTEGQNVSEISQENSGNSEADTKTSQGQVSKEYVENLLFGSKNATENSQEIVTESLNVETKEEDVEQNQESYFVKGKAFVSSHKKALIAAGIASVAIVCKHAYDYANTTDAVVSDLTPIEPTVVLPIVEPVLPVIEPVVQPIDELVVPAADPIVPAVAEKPVLDISEINLIVPVVSNAFVKKVKAFDVKNYKAKLSDFIANSPKITAKNVALTTAAIVGASAIAYQLISMYSKPSFDALVKQYIYETQEQDAVVIVEQFIQALEKYGYTSVQDKQKAMQIFVEAGLVEA